MRFERRNLSETSTVRQIGLRHSSDTVCPQPLFPVGRTPGRLPSPFPCSSTAGLLPSVASCLHFGILSLRVCRSGLWFALCGAFQLLSVSLPPGMPNKRTWQPRAASSSCRCAACGRGTGSGQGAAPLAFPTQCPQSHRGSRLRARAVAGDTGRVSSGLTAVSPAGWAAAT